MIPKRSKTILNLALTADTETELSLSAFEKIHSLEFKTRDDVALRWADVESGTENAGVHFSFSETESYFSEDLYAPPENFGPYFFRSLGSGTVLEVIIWE